MSETFKVGEIAILKHLTHWTQYEGQEGEITGPLESRCGTRPDGTWVMACAYEVKICTGETLFIQPQFLRKRPSPPNWLAIASKQTVPEGVPIKSPEYA